MKKKILEEIIIKKKNKIEFAIITNLENSESFIYEKDKSIHKNFEKYSKEINLNFNMKKSGVMEGTNIFIESYNLPIKVIIIGAVHIAQYLVSFMKYLNFEIFIIDPRDYFTSTKRFPDTKILNKWPDEAFKKIETNKNTALIALTHDPKIDDSALKYAMKNNFFYIGALGSKKTHTNRCLRLKDSNFPLEKINKIHGPIGIKLGGKSAPEIALSITAQLVSKVYQQ
tara:strand:- start:254 stop:934 length:681 start_codon:yes stop_codon:yes gene_type:complete